MRHDEIGRGAVKEITSGPMRNDDGGCVSVRLQGCYSRLDVWMCRRLDEGHDSRACKEMAGSQSSFGGRNCALVHKAKMMSYHDDGSVHDVSGRA